MSRIAQRSAMEHTVGVNPKRPRPVESRHVNQSVDYNRNPEQAAPWVIPDDIDKQHDDCRPHDIAVDGQRGFRRNIRGIPRCIQRVGDTAGEEDHHHSGIDHQHDVLDRFSDVRIHRYCNGQADQHQYRQHQRIELFLQFERKNTAFYKKWITIKELVEQNYQPLFWNAELGFLADYVDGAGQHLELRPNQLWAVSLDNRCVDDEVVSEVMRVVNAELVTRRGIRTLSPRDIRYKGVYEGPQKERDEAYHNGCAWPFLLAQYCYASFNMMGKNFIKRAEWLTEGFYEDLSKHGVGCFSELYDGDPPHEAHGAISSAMTTAALLNINWLIEKYREE